MFIIDAGVTREQMTGKSGWNSFECSLFNDVTPKQIN